MMKTYINPDLTCEVFRVTGQKRLSWKGHPKEQVIPCNTRSPEVGKPTSSLAQVTPAHLILDTVWTFLCPLQRHFPKGENESILDKLGAPLGLALRDVGTLKRN